MSCPWFLLLVIFLGLATVGAAEDEGIAYPEAGAIRPRPSREIKTSNWSVGAETMDRGYTIYDNWKDYLGALGVKKARIQAGWARTERRPGVYDFAWLDAIVFDMVKQGVEPWMNLSYGNPIYPDVGSISLRSSVPTSKVTLAAWQKWVRATVERYRKVIDEWEIWNEPSWPAGLQATDHLAIRCPHLYSLLAPTGRVHFTVAFGKVHLRPSSSKRQACRRCFTQASLLLNPSRVRPPQIGGRSSATLLRPSIS